MIKQFIQQLRQTFSAEQLITDELLRYAYATDASPYRMLPQLVVMAFNEGEVIRLVKIAGKFGIKLTFRAAGTSLSGQAVTDQVLVMLAHSSWRDYKISSNGRQISLQPGIIGAEANQWLAAYKRQIGPDPGSINVAKIGGIIANNSSGMCCGTSKNSYATLASLRAVFADGSVLASSDPQNINLFRQQQAELIAGIAQLRDEIMADLPLVAFIRKKFAIKNTSGYSLNAFLDFNEPIKIIERLLVGSEGTLAFISQVTLNTVANEEFKALNIVYGTLENLINLTLQIAEFTPSAIELLDYCSLQSVAAIKSLQPYLIPLDESVAAIMIEVTAPTQELLDTKLSQITQVIGHAKIIQQTGFSQDGQVAQILWQARKGILPTIAGQRPLGSSVLIEDVAVEIQQLPALITDLRELFKVFGYANAAIFGHVLAGNLHFVLTPNFSLASELLAYEQFMRSFTQLVATKFNGSLKAEHGSGRNIAPFALLEWGQQCWDIMWRIKALFDPLNILNPEVKLTRDTSLHLQNLKHLTVVDPLIAKCMECGFCEPVCPSRNLTLTPRQRISVARKINSLSGIQRQKWEQSYQYYGIDSCTTTGMCQTVCPVGINTGEFILSLKPKQIKHQNHAKNIGRARWQLKLANALASVIGRDNLQHISSHAHKKFKTIPIYPATMPKVQAANFTATPKKTAPGNSLLLLPACPNRIFAASQSATFYAYQALLEKLGYSVTYPAQLEKLCCGQMYHAECNSIQQQQAIAELKQALPAGALALIDNSSCAGFAKNAGLAVQDINLFLVENIPRHKLVKRYPKLALHIDCSTAKHSFNSEYLAVLQRCAVEIIIPQGIKCCGFAGAKGFTTPELNASSLAQLAPQVIECNIGVSFNRNCQIGLSYHGGIEYISFAELLLECWSGLS